MDESLATRKAALAGKLKEAYAVKEPSALFAASQVYKDPEEIADISTRVFPESGEVMVSQYRSAEAVLAVIFLILSTLFIINKIQKGNTDALSMIFLLIWISALIYFIVRSLNNSPRLIMNKESIWIWKPEKYIPWQHIAVGFIKIVDHGESDDDHYLVIHYYEPGMDDFEKLEVKLNNLNFAVEEIAGYFEFFLKQSNGNAE